ncbi:MAG: cytochrome b/b6 domain-containing protein [Paracoccaceae bacterium]
MSKPPNYRRSQIILHWVILLLIAFNIIAHDGMKAMYKAREDSTALASVDAVFGYLHIIVGISVLVLAVLRLGLRLRHGAPAAPAGPRAQQIASHVVHWAIYVLLFTLPLSGMSAWFANIPAAADAHELMKGALLLLVALHVAAALFHQFWLKDNLMARMSLRR